MFAPWATFVFAIILRKGKMFCSHLQIGTKLLSVASETEASRKLQCRITEAAIASRERLAPVQSRA